MSRRKPIVKQVNTPKPRLPEFVPLNQEQADAYKMCGRNSIVFLTGPAGCSKSYTAIAYAINELLTNRVGRIVLTRPAVEACGENLGFLPGTASQKVGEYMAPLFDNMREYASAHMEAIRPHLEIAPLAFMRGRTLKDSVVILDEAQNANLSQLEMLLTRIGEGTTMILCGDADQADIWSTPLMAVARRQCVARGISHFHFSDASCMIRHPLIPSIIEGFRELRDAGKTNA